jgi:hypothetical protein
VIQRKRKPTRISQQHHSTGHFSSTMRTSIFAAAALAAGALAVPMEKRDVVTEVDRNVVYVTQYTTVTAGSKPTPAAESPAKHYGHHVQWGHRPNWWNQPNKGEGTTKKVTTHTATWEPAPSPSPSKTKAASPPPAYTSPASTGGSAPSGYAGQVVDSHNIHRANHSASNIEWDQGLADIAAQIAATCIYEHNT